MTLAAVVLAGGVATGIALSRGGSVPSVGPVDTRAYENSPVTGTGPGLIRVADQSATAKTYEGPISGTGPGLALMAGAGGAIESTDRGSVSPRHRVVPQQGRASSSTPGHADCVSVAGRPIC
jgi:hypothetical protein